MLDATYSPYPYLELVKSKLNQIFKERKELFVLEPAAGDARILEMIREIFQTKKLHLTAVEEDPIKYPYYINAYSPQDFLKWETEVRYDLIITGPPWSLYKEYLRKCKRLLKPGGWVVLLITFNIFHFYNAYDEFFKRWMPISIIQPNNKAKFLSMKPEKFNEEVSIRDPVGWMFWQDGVNGYMNSGGAIHFVADVRDYK